MSLTRATLYPAGEVASILRRYLGPLREWSDCLADMRTGKTNVAGNVLLPTGLVHDLRAWRPAYAPADIARFIRAVLADVPEAESNVPARFLTVTVDSSDTRSWKARKLTSATLVRPPSVHAIGAAYA
jgi:hypothetical protein